MAFNMYGSTGYEILGFEIKISRSDWLNELKDMSKSDEIMSYCDKWYLVVPEEKIVQPGELPKNWGLLVLKGEKLVQKVRPMQNPTSPMPMHFIASILRKSGDEVSRIRNEHVRREDIKNEISEARKQGYEDARGYNGKRTEEELSKLRELVKIFEDASGIPFDTWRGKDNVQKIGKYVKLAMDITGDGIQYDLQRIESAARKLDGAVLAMKKIEKEFGKKDS